LAKNAIPQDFYEILISGTSIFQKNIAIANAAVLPYIMG
jgi:hypothetical protein